MKSIKRILAVVMAIALMVGCFAISASAEFDRDKVQFIQLNYKGSFDNSTLAQNEIYMTLEALKEVGVVTCEETSKDVFEYSYNGVLIYTIDFVKSIAYGSLETTEKQNFYHEFTDAEIETINNGTNEYAKAFFTYGNHGYTQVTVFAATNYVVDVSEEYAKANNGEESIIEVDNFEDIDNLMRVCNIEIAGMGLLENGTLDLNTRKVGNESKPVVYNKETDKSYFYLYEKEIEKGVYSIGFYLLPDVTYEDNIYWEADADLLAEYATDDYCGEMFNSIIFIHGKTAYEVKEEKATATWTQGGKDGATLTSTADFSKFVSVTVDGNVVDAANFDAVEGSTKITFKPEYLSTLSVGNHPVVIKSLDGDAEGTLVIVAGAKEEEVANTADNSAIGVFVALGTIAAAGFVTLKKRED